MTQAQLVQDDYPITEHRWEQQMFKDFLNYQRRIEIEKIKSRGSVRAHESLGQHLSDFSDAQKRERFGAQRSHVWLSGHDTKEPILLLITALLTVPSRVSRRKAVCSSRLRSSGRAGEDDLSDSCSDLSDACSISAILICCKKVSSV